MFNELLILNTVISISGIISCSGCSVLFGIISTVDDLFLTNRQNAERQKQTTVGQRRRVVAHKHASFTVPAALHSLIGVTFWFPPLAESS